MKDKKFIKICKIIMKLIKKIIMSIGITALLFAVYALLRTFVLTLDGGWNTYVFDFGFILMEIIFLAAIWFEKHREWCPVLGFLVVFFGLINMVYYECISTDLEATWHFHSAHNIPFSKFSIEKSYKYDSGPLFGSGSARGVDILYDGVEYSVYNVDGKWFDNYDDIVAFQELNTKVMGQLESIMTKTNKKYQIFSPPFLERAYEYTYDIILYTEDKALENEKIVELDTCILDMNEKNGEYSDWSATSYVAYHLYTVRDLKLYKKLCKRKKKQDTEYFSHFDNILTELYDSDKLSCIYETDRYNYNAFQEYGNMSSTKKTTIFLYSSSDEERELEVYTIKH